MKRMLTIAVSILLVPALSVIVDAQEGKEVKIHVAADQVTVTDALPAESNGVNISKTPTFNSMVRKAKQNVVSLKVSAEPIFIVEGELPKTAALKPQDSPFGFLPANVNNSDYSYALDIGVVWERGGIFPFFWSVVQADPNVPDYNWESYDQYFRQLPEGIREVKNISVTRIPSGPMMRSKTQGDQQNKLFSREPRRPPGGLTSREQNQSGFSKQHISGDSYLPSNVDAYIRWVKATVERYNGDGKNDMPGLKNPVKFWQIDNEPGNLRPGYADLVCLTSKAIKQEDPSAKVILGGLFLPVQNMKKRYESTQRSLLENIGACIDIVDIHWFGQHGEWKLFPDSLKEIKSDLQRFGIENKQMYMTEVGTYSGKPRNPLEFTIEHQSERDQAAEMLKRYVVSLNAGVKRVFWAWGVMEGYGNPNDNDFFDNTGVIYDGVGSNDPGKGVKKISYWTYKKMTDLLKFWDGSPPERLDIARDIHAYRFKFHNRDDQGIVVIWAD